MNPKFKLANSKQVLLQNTFMLYLLTFSNYFLSLVVVPYETRILGPTVYGTLGAATAIMVYFQLALVFSSPEPRRSPEAGTIGLRSAGFSPPQPWPSFCSSSYPWPLWLCCVR